MNRDGVSPIAGLKLKVKGYFLVWGCGWDREKGLFRVFLGCF